MCNCGIATKDPLTVNGVSVYYSNYQTFDYKPDVELVLLKKLVSTPVSTTTSFDNTVKLSYSQHYVIVSREEADELLLLYKPRVRSHYFKEIENYEIDGDIVKELP